jgi:hypothetical protein
MNATNTIVSIGFAVFYGFAALLVLAVVLTNLLPILGLAVVFYGITRWK